MKRWWLSVIAIVVLLVTAPLLALRSETITRVVLPELLRMVPGKLELELESGALAGPMHLRAVEWSQDGRRIRIDSLQVDWTPFALLAGDLDLLEIHAGRVEVEWPESGRAREPFDAEALLRKLDPPLDISLGRLRIEDFNWPGNAQLEQLRVDASGLVFSDTRVGIGDIRLQREDMSGHASASLDLAPPYRARADIDIDAGNTRLLQGQQRLAGQLRLDGNLAQLAAELRLQQPLRAKLDAQLSELLHAPQWQGELELDDSDPRSIIGESPLQRLGLALSFEGSPEGTSIGGRASATLAGRALELEPKLRFLPARLESRGTRVLVEAYGFDGRLDGWYDWRDGQRLDLQLQADSASAPLAGPGGEPLDLAGSRLAVRGSLRRLELELDALAGSGELQLAGTVQLDSGRIDARGDWRGLELLAGPEVMQLADGRARFAGKPEQFEFSLESSLRYGELPQGRLQLSGAGGPEAIELQLDRLDWLQGQGKGRARLARGPTRIDWSLRVEGIQLQPLLPQLRSDLDAAFSGSSSFAGGAHRLQLESLGGSLNGNALSGTGSVTLRQESWSARDIELSLGDAGASLDGDSAADGIDIRVDIPSIRQLDARFDGQARLQANWHRRGSDDSIVMQADGRELRLPGFTAAEADISMDFIADGSQPSRVDAKLADARISGVEMDTAELQLRGRDSAHDIALQADTPAGELQLAATGAWRDERWRGELLRLDVQPLQSGRWTLQQSTALAAGAGLLEFEQLCLQQAAARLCASANWNQPAWRMSVRLRDAELEQFGSLLPAGLAYQGGVRLDLDAGNTPALGVDARLELGAGGLRERGRGASAGDTGELLEWKSGLLELELANERWNTSLALDLGASGSLSGGGHVDVPADARPASMALRLQARLDELDLVSALYPEINSIDGRFTADMDFAGTLQQPRVTGSAKLDDGSLQFARYGLQLEAIKLALQGNGRELELDGSMQSGGGELRTSLSLAEDDGRLQVNGRLQGERFLASNTRELELRISPDLELQADGRSIRLGGQLEVPSADIRPRQLSGTVSASEDQVFVDEVRRPGAAPERLEVHAEIRTLLGDDVHFEGFGLTADIGGDLTVIREPDSPARGQGRLALRGGRYLAYGQRLSLQRGELIYTGQPISEPGLDVRAVRQPAPDITVGVNLRGSLQQPELSLFSEPPMPEQTQLAWLVLGRPAVLNSEEQQQVDSTAIALGLGSGAITSELRDSLDLEEASIQNLDNREEASLVLGKYLSSDLYVSYGIGLFEAANTFRIRYRLSSKWTLEAVSGLESSADFLYTIER